jgi:O-antigen ligase
MKVSRWVIFCLAALACIAPLKFGTPVIHQSELMPPAELSQWVFFSWPNQLLYMFVFGALLWWVLDAERLAACVDLLFSLPLFFFATQALAALNSINWQVTSDTLTHFGACVLLFYAAAWYVRDGAAAGWILCGLVLATIWVCLQALDQRYGFLLGGFEQTRQFASTYIDRSTLPQDFLTRMTSNRVFAGFGGYPNALAGYLAMVFVPVLAWLWVRARSWHRGVKWVVMLFFGGLMLWCVWLTGSRGGQLALGAAVVTALWWLLHERPAKFWLAVGLLLFAGLIVFARGRGAESFRARVDYWRGAVAIGRDHPWTGIGPGAFGSIYPKYKTARTEEAQLAHNDYLQMWSDSGVAGFVAFALLWMVAVRDAFRLARQRAGDAAALAICAAIAAWTIHGLFDFDLYVPGLAVPAFLFLGMLQGLKELPQLKSVTPRGRAKWIVGIACAAVASSLVWIQSRSLAANIAYGNARTFRQAAEAFRAARLAPRNSRYQSVAGDAALHAGKFEEAIQFYRVAVQNDPCRASHHWRLARALATAHVLNNDALNELRQAVALNPTNTRYREELARAEESVRQSPGALLDSPSTKD